MNEESIFSEPFNEKLLQAVTSPNEQDWFKYRLGVESPSFGEVLGLPGARTGRFSRARDEREAAMQAILGLQIKSAFERSQAPSSFQAAQEQNPLGYQLSGIQPSMGGIAQPPQMAGQALGNAPVDYISPPAQQALMQQPLQPSQAHAYMAAIPHAAAAGIESMRLAQARELGRGPLAQLQQHRLVLESALKQTPDDPILQRDLTDINQGIELVTTSQKEGIQPNKVMVSLFPGSKSYAQPNGVMVTPDDEVRLAKLAQMTGVPIVAKTGMTKQEAVDATLYQRQIGIAGAAAGAAATAGQAARLVQPGVRSDLYERGPFFKTGELKNAPSGITETQAAKGNYIQLSDKQRADLAHTEQAGIQLDQIFGMADKLITAKTGLQAWKQAGVLNLGILSRNPAYATAKVYQDSLDALSNSLSRSLGGERGVLTNVDVLRWVNAMPKFSDTAAIKDAKSKLIKLIYQTSVDAQRRALAGDDVTAKKTELGKMLERLTTLDEEGTKAATPKRGAIIEFKDLPSGGP